MKTLSRRRLPVKRQDAKAHLEAASWNAKHSTGTLVRYWPGIRDGEGLTGRTRSAADVVSGQAVVWIDNKPGCVALSHVEAINEAVVCQHDRLNEDGICRACGADKRGIG